MNNNIFKDTDKNEIHISLKQPRNYHFPGIYLFYKKHSNFVFKDFYSSGALWLADVDYIISIEFFESKRKKNSLSRNVPNEKR